MPDRAPEIFASLQGEGVTAGVPSVFVRLAGCNLTCRWCDTPYAWDWSRYDPSAETIALSVEDVLERVLRAELENVVITGGEPLLQAAALAPLARELKARGRRLEIETNGTLPPPTEMAAVIDQWNVSPKLTGSGVAASHREHPPALAWFGREPEAYFKFVVTAPEDVDEVRAIVTCYAVPPRRVLLMPEGTTPEMLLERSPWVAEHCRQLGYRYSPRLHILLWGDRRGR
jgi:organic radical activating enzyme